MVDYVPIAHARDELKRIDAVLDSPHLLIGGLAVQQYYQVRDSQDIDLVCRAATVSGIIEKLYPTSRFTIEDRNDDALRPAWVITERLPGATGRTTYIGPKILERESYQFVDYDWMMSHSVPYRRGAETLKNVRVPRLEATALLKLLSLATRLESSPIKGEQDLCDFVNLTNVTDFKVNAFLDLIAPECREHLATRIAQFTQDRGTLFADSSLGELFELLFPPRIKPLSGGGVVKVHSPESALEFYGVVAGRYDSRNSDFLYHAHQYVIGELRKLFNSGSVTGVLDLGCGTGKMIAAHFVHRDIRWIGVDGCAEMLEQFSNNTNMDHSQMDVKLIQGDLHAMDPNNIADEMVGNSWVGVVSFLLTSMPDDSLLEMVAASLPQVTTLIIADIHPRYTLKHPHYDFSVPGIGEVNLEPRPVFPDVLQDILARGGFRPESQYLGRRTGSGEPYAFVHTFTRIVELESGTSAQES